MNTHRRLAHIITDGLLYAWGGLHHTGHGTANIGGNPIAVRKEVFEDEAGVFPSLQEVDAIKQYHRGQGWRWCYRCCVRVVYLLQYSKEYRGGAGVVDFVFSCLPTI